MGILSWEGTLGKGFVGGGGLPQVGLGGSGPSEHGILRAHRKSHHAFGAVASLLLGISCFPMGWLWGRGCHGPEFFPVFGKKDLGTLPGTGSITS